MTKMNKILRSAMLAAGLLAGFVPAMTAQAGAIYFGELDVTLKVVTTQVGVTITGDTDVVLLDSSAVGNLGTLASAALDLEPDDPTVLAAGDALTMTTKLFSGFEGKSANGPLLSTATSDVHGEGVVTVENSSQNNAKIVFDLTYSLSGTAAIDDAAFDAAFVNVLFEIWTQSGFSLSEKVTVDLPAGGLSGGSTFGNTIPLTLALAAEESDKIFLSATLQGTAETQATPVPLPATLPLFATGLAALGLTARRWHARSV